MEESLIQQIEARRAKVARVEAHMKWIWNVYEFQKAMRYEINFELC